MRYPWEFSGVVIDGPDRGKSVVRDVPYYRTYMPPSPTTPYLWGEIGPEIRIEEITYKWSRSLDQWCMIY